MTHSELVDAIIAYESGELDSDKILELFAYLIKTGLAWSLQGHYGRAAIRMMCAGLIDENGEILPTPVD